MASYVPSTPEEQLKMLNEAGFSSFDEMLSPIPDSLRLKGPLDIEKGQSEMETLRFLSDMAGKNTRYKSVFRGGGAYYHYIPPVVSAMASREEFVTAYTPYQAEMSQGVLQAIFEYQTMICELTGLDVSNASVYDGASAAAEAVLMCRERSRNRAIISGAAHPDVIDTIKTYCAGYGVEVTVLPPVGGRTDLMGLKEAMGPDAACLYLAQPNFFGLIEDAKEAAAIARQAGARLIMGVNPVSMGLLDNPKSCGADIAVGEGQPLGMPLSFGGPYLGFMAASKDMMRRLPGRIVGQTTDRHGRRAFVLTLQAREQHIKREKATSSICSNQALCALTASIYLSAMGPRGLFEVASQCHDKAVYLASRLCELPGFSLPFDGTFFHEFVTTCPIDPKLLEAGLGKRGILAGLPLCSDMAGHMLWCVTEMASKADIDELVEAVKEVVGIG